MNKAFTKESDYDPALDVVARPHPPVPDGVKNYITPEGAERMRAELRELMESARPALLKRLAELAAAERREDPVYQDAQRGLRQIEQQGAWLEERIATLEVVETPPSTDRVRFGATVRVLDEEGSEASWRIVGIDEADPARGRLSWISPIAKALLAHQVGDEVCVALPGSLATLEIVEVRYDGRPRDAAG